jgi:hypothetical protein
MPEPERYSPPLAERVELESTRPLARPETAAPSTPAAKGAGEPAPEGAEEAPPPKEADEDTSPPIVAWGAMMDGYSTATYTDEGEE